MARLRIRIELNRGGVGVPLHKLASVVEQAQTFFHMLADDVHVDQSQGEWLGFDFDHESLNFTAEFVGPVTQEQVNAFHAAFDGTTSLRPATIGQFARITEAIGEDEMVGFGLYLSDQNEEPAEWRALSRRDALRITEEMQLLAGASGESEQETHLPAAANSAMAARLFSERRDRIAEPAKLIAYVREVEAGLDKRMGRVEKAIEDQSGLIGDLHAKSNSTEDSVRRLLTAVEGFCAQTTRQLEAMSGAPALEVAAVEAPAMEASAVAEAPEPAAPVLDTLPGPESEPAPVLEATSPLAMAAAATGTGVVPQAKPDPEPAPKPEPQPSVVRAWTPVERPTPGPRSSWSSHSDRLFPRSQRDWRVAAGAALLVIGVGLLGTWAWENFSATNASAEAAATDSVKTPAASLPAAQAPVSETPPAPPASTVAVNSRVYLQATELTWVAVRGAGGQAILARLFAAGDDQNLDLPNGAVLRVGNAGGISLKLNGNAIGAIGAHGQVREVVFRDGAYKISASE